MLEHTKRFTFELSNACNLAPIHDKCPAHHVKQIKVLDTRIIHQTIDWAASKSFTGGFAFHTYNEPMMIEHAQIKVCDPRVQFVCANALEFDYNRANLFVCYYTLQFIAPSVRLDLLKRIYSSLHWGGALLLFEKVRAPDARFQDYMSQLYNEFKLDNGFSEAEIINKARSLKGVLEPFSEHGNLTLLREAGFSDIATVFKWISFQGWLIIK